MKHENHLPVGAFKVRGGINLISQLSEAERAAGVACASTGNHGQSVAYAASLFGVRATVVMPDQANPVKVEAMRALGADVQFYGRDFDEAREQCEREAALHGYRYIHSGNEPDLIAGVGTCALEILESWPDAEVLVVPVGGGSGAAGACIVAQAVRPSIEVIGVQAEAAPAAFRSWQARALVEDSTSTFAEASAIWSSPRARPRWPRASGRPGPVRRPQRRRRVQRRQHQPGPADGTAGLASCVAGRPRRESATRR